MQLNSVKSVLPRLPELFKHCEDFNIIMIIFQRHNFRLENPLFLDDLVTWGKKVDLTGGGVMILVNNRIKYTVSHFNFHTEISRNVEKIRKNVLNKNC